MKKDYSSGSELHRLKEVQDYDEKQFNELYKIVLPYIKRLSYNIDVRRLNVTRDLVQSYFLDKFLHTYFRYHQEYDFERLKANILTSLKRYSYRLMREGYTQRSQFNQSLVSFEDLFDDSKEDILENPNSEYHLELIREFMKARLSPDEYLIWRVVIDPPHFFYERMKKSKGKLSIAHLMDFFEFPRNRASYKYFSKILRKINETQEEAKVTLR